ncbi:MAG TPA: IS91 family transposase [Gemmatimonadales bacterium]|nr:IS91 family transposase [Gemmatimonadales bacterium]
MTCPALAGRPRWDIAEIVRRHRAKLEAHVRLTLEQRGVLRAIELCRTAALGGHLDVCRACGYEHAAYNSCRNRHCPKCQALAQERWIGARAERLLPVHHFHVVFTLPSELRGLAKFRPRELYDALFAAAAETLLKLGRTRLSAKLGVTMVLHTWTRDLRLHPHVHAIVTAGGLGIEGEGWRPSSQKYLFPVQVMGALLRGKMMDALRRLHARGVFSRFDDFADPEGFDSLMGRLAKIDWLVHVKKPFRDARFVLRYLGRYTHRVAISNSRLVAVTDDVVTFRTKDGKTATLGPVEFLRRFVQHVLPDGLHKIRHFGLYAGTHAHGALLVARTALSTSAAAAVQPLGGENSTATASWSQLLCLLTGRDPDRCPRCGERLEHVPVVPSARAPPQRLVA